MNAIIDNSGILCTPKKACENCGLQGRLFFGGLHDRLFTAPGEWNLLRCPDASCGLLWIDPQPLPDQIGKLYGGYYTHGDVAVRGAATSPYESQGMKRLLKRLLSVVFFWKPHVFRTDYFHLEDMRSGRLLEIGCGNGSFLAAAACKGWQSFGIDLDQAAIAYACKLPGVTAQVAELIGTQYPDGYFDAIVMSNVIEHIWNPIETLAECYRILRPGGRIVMITPNSNSTGLELFGQDWRGLEPPRHLFIYNDRVLKSFSRRTGFSRVAIFSSPCGSVGRMMLLSSIELARKADRATRAGPSAVPGIVRRERLLDLFGRSKGEWIILVGGK